MPLSDLTNADRTLVKSCLDCIAAGKVIAHDWEFSIIMGVDVDQFRTICGAWPDVDETDVRVQCAVGNGMNNLLGYPHSAQRNWDAHIPVPRAAVQRLICLWRGRPITSYVDGFV